MSYYYLQYFLCTSVSSNWFLLCLFSADQVPGGVPAAAARARRPRHVPRRARQLHAVVHPVGHHQRHLRELAAGLEVVMTHTVVNHCVFMICRLKNQAVIRTMLENVVFAVDFFCLI